MGMKKNKKKSNVASQKRKKVDGGKIYPVIDSVQQDSKPVDSNVPNIPSSEYSKIVNFVKCMTEKNYAEANKYLRSAIEDKAKMRIRSAM